MNETTIYSEFENGCFLCACLDDIDELCSSCREQTDYENAKFPKVE
jgi:hypothetical protein